jgi:hypothetical protein
MALRARKVPVRSYPSGFQGVVTYLTRLEADQPEGGVELLTWAPHRELYDFRAGYPIDILPSGVGLVFHLSEVTSFYFNLISLSVNASSSFSVFSILESARCKGVCNIFSYLLF